MMNNSKEKFLEMMVEQKEIALATCVGEIPNVRIVNFFYDEKRRCVFFSTFKGNEKILEFEQNPRVSFTTIPVGITNHVRVHYGHVKKSKQTVFDVAEQWIAKIPSYEENIQQAGVMLELYEIHFSEAIVILGMDSSEIIDI